MRPHAGTVRFPLTDVAVFTPILLEKFASTNLDGFVFIILKQFGTGVIVSTAYVHVRRFFDRGGTVR